MSGAEDGADSLSPVVADDDIVSELSSDEVQEIMDDREGDYSDGWLSAGGEESNEDDPGSPHRWKTMDDQQSESFEDMRMTQKDSCSQPQCIPHVKTSAIMGVGLQELLELIDSKQELLDTQKEVERDSFSRKWRPPRTEDAGTAVEL